MWHKISRQIWVLFGVKCIIILSANYPLNKTCIHHNNLQKASITKCMASAFKQIYTIIYIKFLIQTVTRTKYITVISALCEPSHSHNNYFWHYQNFLYIIYTGIMLTLFLEGDKPSLWMSFSGTHFLKPSLISENLYASGASFREMFTILFSFVRGWRAILLHFWTTGVSTCLQMLKWLLS